MTKAEIQQEVIRLLEAQDISDAKPHQTLRGDLGMDSLDEVEYIMSVEKAFNLSLPDDQCEKVKTVEDVVNLVNTYVNG